MTMLDHAQASGQGEQSPHSDGLLYSILHTHQTWCLQTIIGPMKESLRGKHYDSKEEEKTAEIKKLKQ